MYVQCGIHRRIRMCPFIIPIILFCCFFFRKKNRNYLKFVCVVSFLIVFKFFLHFIFGIPIRLFGRLKRSIPNRITSMQIVSFHCRLSNYIFFFQNRNRNRKGTSSSLIWYIDTYTYMCVKANAKLIGKHFERVQSLAPRLICCDK